jgi:hypothetical protein
VREPLAANDHRAVLLDAGRGDQALDEQVGSGRKGQTGNWTNPFTYEPSGHKR